ncbi:MAG: LD-carboxypeptidase [Clostridiales bacterium]|nr:LD-carboxypeptidase [Clostridiales bacterium]
MFADDEVDAIFCVRGGDGGNRAMGYIDEDIIRNNPKIFVGYSDVTSMHLLFNQRCNLVTFHGPMGSSNMVDEFDDETRESLIRALTAEGDLEFVNPKRRDIKVFREGKANGRIVGGNLTLLTASMGTWYEVDTDGCILFIEDVHGDMEEIDRDLYVLRNSGKLRQAKGLLVGQFTDCVNRHEENFGLMDVVEDAMEDIDIPVMYNIQSGHGFPMMTIPMGEECSIDTSDKSIIFHMR